MKYGSEQSGRLIRGGQFLGVGLAAVSSLVLLDGHASRQTWPSTKTRLVGVPSPDVEELTIAFPGLGSTGGPEQAQHIRRVVSGPSAYFEYSSDRISVQGLAKIMRQEAPNLKRVNLSGHSMGGPLGLETARQARGSETRLGRVVLLSSPFGIHDGKSGRASNVLKAVKWSPGPGHKFVFQAIRSKLEGQSLRASIEQARRDAKTGCSPRVWLSMLSILQGVEFQRHKAEYADMVDDDTEFCYCMPEDPDRDLAVFTEPACEQYGEFCADIGARFRVFHVPDVGHAEVVPTMDYLEFMMAKPADTNLVELIA